MDGYNCLGEERKGCLLCDAVGVGCDSVRQRFIGVRVFVAEDSPAGSPGSIVPIPPKTLRRLEARSGGRGRSGRGVPEGRLS